MTEQTKTEGKPLSFGGWIIILLCLLPWAVGLNFGLLISPFIRGFKDGRDIAGEIFRDHVGDGVSEDK